MNNSLFSLATIAVATLSITGCYSSNTVRTPAGERTSHMYAAGLVTTSTTDTMVSFDRCRGLLKPGHPDDAPMIDREVYDKCFSDAMVGVDPRGQLPQPTPVDLNGDGRPDVVRYMDGMQVPYGLYQMYPGVYWPQVYGYYGVSPQALMPSGNYGLRPTGYNGEFLNRGAVPGYPGDPATAGTPAHLVTDQQLNETLDPVVTEVDHNATDVVKNARRLDALEGGK